MVKYPMGHGPKKQIKLKRNKKINYGSRGMSLEERLNKSNQYYLTHNLAVIHKKPTPTSSCSSRLSKTKCCSDHRSILPSCFTRRIIMVYIKAEYINLEAKETKNKTSFPLSNLPEHQREHMLSCLDQGGIAFLIVSFSELDEIYLLPYQYIHQYIKNNDKQSLTYDFIKENGYECPTGIFPMIDYLKALDKYLLEKN